MDLRLRLRYLPSYRSKLYLAGFHLGHTPYGGSKVPCGFLSLDILLRSHPRPFRVAHDRGGWVTLLPDALGVHGSKHGIELWFDTDLGNEY